MKELFDSIIKNALNIIELAKCDSECSLDDFCVDDYRESLDEMSRCLEEIEKKRKEVK